MLKGNKKPIVYFFVGILVLSLGCLGGTQEKTSVQPVVEENLVEPTSELNLLITGFDFVPNTDSVKSGLIKISIKNEDTIEHELMVYKKDDAKKVLTMHAGQHAIREDQVDSDEHDDNEDVHEDEHGEEHEDQHSQEHEELTMDELVLLTLTKDDLPPGGQKTVQVELEPGVYELGCHFVGHYEAGMKRDITVV